jgi:Lon protease-like protein
MPNYDHLPGTLPIFPLESAVVMPQADLPLNIFEPRYLNMVQDALATHHMFGMVQPDYSRKGSPTPVYRTGCAGRITSYRETPDGRILLALSGVCRFDISEELATTRGYRAVVPDWSRFALDIEKQADQALTDRTRFLGALKRYLKSKEMDTDWKSLEQAPDLQLVHALTTLLPLEPADKQAILESIEPSGQADALLASLEMSLHNGQPPLQH